MGDDDSITVQHVFFLWFVFKRFAKEVFMPNVNGVKVLATSVIGTVGLQRAMDWNASHSWCNLCEFGYYMCFFAAALETIHLCCRLPTLHRLYFCCFNPRSQWNGCIDDHCWKVEKKLMQNKHVMFLIFKMIKRSRKKIWKRGRKTGVHVKRRFWGAIKRLRRRKPKKRGNVISKSK